MTSTAPAGWDGILDEGETILWQGRPDAKVVFTAGHFFTSIFGIFFAGFALFWMILASRAGGGFWMFGLLHFTVGLVVIVAPIAGPAWARRHTWYTLTDKRAFIATDIPVQGRKLKSYDIGEKSVLDFRAGDPATVYFASEYRQTKNGSRQVPIGFERIDDGETVYRLIRDIQTGQTGAAQQG